MTAQGMLMARLPLDPRMSRMIIEARQLNCLAEVAVIAAALSIQEPRLRPASEEEKADVAHTRRISSGLVMDLTGGCVDGAFN